MNLVKIATMQRKKFSEFYDIKHYRKQMSKQFVVRQYKINSQKVIIDESLNE